MLEAIFFLSLIVIVFIYALYGPIMMLFKNFREEEPVDLTKKWELPSISLVIPAFNEEGWIAEKINNSLQLEYPSDKIEIIVVTDGSDDNTAKIASAFKNKIVTLHESERNGKINAMDRASVIAKNEILIFTDANTVLNTESIRYIAENFSNPKVGMVSGEKKVLSTKEGESASGEGLYWKYESWLKKLDSDVSSVIGAAGELFAIRSKLYSSLPADTLLDDFMLSTKVLESGYKVAYEPRAFAIEYGSASYKEEWKRKVRICAGGIQSITRSTALFNVKKYGLKSFSFIIHRASRWTIAPLALIISYTTSGLLISESPVFLCYFIVGSLGLFITYFTIQKNLKSLPKPLLLIVYFTFMHISAIAGWFRYFGKKQSVNWERSLRLS